jgi:nucleotidyltransferase/DNA polymerase involved in DNA repair
MDISPNAPKIKNGALAYGITHPTSFTTKKHIEVKTMEPDKIIEAFTQVVREQDYVFSDNAIADLPMLQKNLAALKENLNSQVIAEVIRQWYKNHKSVIDAMLVEEREIRKVAKTKPQSQENTLENRYRVLQEEVQKLQEKKKGDEQK